MASSPARKQSVFPSSSPLVRQTSKLGLGIIQDDQAAAEGVYAISESIREKIEDVDVKSAVAKIKDGDFLTKYCRNPLTKPHQRLFKVNMEVLSLKWTSPKKSPDRTQIFLTEIDRIVPGDDSDFWRNKPDAERSLGIELLSSTKKLRVVCANAHEWKIWLRGLLYAHEKAVTKRKRANSRTNDFIRKQWNIADKDESGSIQFSELVGLLQVLNCRVDVRYVEQLFDHFETDGSRVLEYDEFTELIRLLLTHKAVVDCFTDWSENLHIDEEGFKEFLLQVQQTPDDQIDECLKVMRNLNEPFTQIKDGSKELSELGFNFLMCSDFNSIMHPKKTVVYQDMSQPISQYWIASSHNTYLTGDQVVGRSAVGQYIDILLQGCRCVELDCWDGPDGEPIIYHGHTLTSRIPFGAVVKACKDYGFKKSPYPIILSLEMHCGTKQKQKVGQILNEILGDSMYRHSPGERAPTPKQLKGFFILKGKKPNNNGEEQEEGNEEDLLMEEEEMRMEILTGFPDQFVSEQPIGGTFGGQAAKLPNGPPQPAAPARRYPELDSYYATISMTGKKLKGIEDTTREAMDVCSLSEKKVSKLMATRSAELAEFHQSYLSRVYPSGTRLMSSNYNPMPSWLLGAQMVALNYQALGLATMLNVGRFSDNGSCGYVLKPEIMRVDKQPFDPNNPAGDAKGAVKTVIETPIILKIKILAAQQLPRPSTDNKRQGNRRKDVACPYIVVSLQGVKGDVKTFRTPHVPNNGLNPRWDEQLFEFSVSCPSVAILLFEVRNYDSVRSEYLASAALPVSCIRSGIRWVELRDARLKLIQWSGLLVEVFIAQAPRPPAPGDPTPAADQGAGAGSGRFQNLNLLATAPGGPPPAIPEDGGRWAPATAPVLQDISMAPMGAPPPSPSKASGAHGGGNKTARAGHSTRESFLGIRRRGDSILNTSGKTDRRTAGKER